MKKLLAIALVFISLVGMVGCSGEKDSEKNNLVQMAYEEALGILDENEKISIETSQTITYIDGNTCDIEFPISDSDYFVVVTYNRENEEADWEFAEIERLTTKLQ